MRITIINLTKNGSLYTHIISLEDYTSFICSEEAPISKTCTDHGANYCPDWSKANKSSQRIPRLLLGNSDRTVVKITFSSPPPAVTC